MPLTEFPFSKPGIINSKKMIVRGAYTAKKSLGGIYKSKMNRIKSTLDNQ